MKFAVALPYHQSGLVPEWAKMAEAAGWDGVFLGDAIWTEDPMVGLSAVAVVTQKIRLGTMLIPVPLRKPWKIASESVMVDQLSQGRLTLGLGTGAAWMGWQGFPDVQTTAKTRTEMLEETIEILTRLYLRKPFDYAGRHYHLKLSAVDQAHYPPKPVQQPRIPLWIPGVWPKEKSMRRALACDGVIVEVSAPDGNPAEPTPEHIAQIKAYVEKERSIDAPFDIVVNGKSGDLEIVQQREKFLALQNAGTTWWIEGFWDEPNEVVTGRIQGGPPPLS